MREISRIVIHHSASSRDRTTKEAIRQWHLDRGWDDIGYHYVITGDGFTNYGRPIERPGAHAIGYNDISIGICLTGNNTRETDKWNDKQKAAAIKLVKALLLVLPDRSISVCGHRDLPGVNTLCPADDLSWLL